MTNWLLAGAAGLALVACSTAARPAPPAVAEEVLVERPADPASASHWSSAAWAAVVPEGPEGRAVLRLAVPAAPAGAGAAVQQDVLGRAIALTAGRYEVVRALDLSGLRGWRVELAVRLRYAGVPRPPVPWEGVQMGCEFTTPIASYGSGLNGQWGDSPWHEARVQVRIPADATTAKLKLGVIATAGSVWLDEVRLTRVEPPLAAQIVPGWEPPRAQRRGTGTGGTYDGWVARLGQEWGVNILKLWVRLPAADLDPAAYQAALDLVLAKLANDLDLVEAAGLVAIPQVSVEWKDPKQGGTHRVFLEPALADRYVESCQRLARRCAGRPGLWGYDLFNEPVLRVPPAVGCPDWEGLAERTARAINVIDPQVRLLVQPEEWWGMRAFEKLRPIDAKNVVYSLHMYEPFALTHQGVGNALKGVRPQRGEGFAYPGLIDGTRWDRQQLRQAVQAARDFQVAHRVPMQVGEFSCIRWAPDGSAARWLADCTALFEEYGWDFTYHGALDWDGWSVEMGDDPADQRILPAPGPAKRALQEAFSRNRAGIR